MSRTGIEVCTGIAGTGIHILELTEVYGTGNDVVPNLSMCPVPVLMSCRTYRSEWYRYLYLAELTEVPGNGIDVVPNLSNWY